MPVEGKYTLFMVIPDHTTHVMLPANTALSSQVTLTY